MRTVGFTVFCFSKCKPHIESQGYTSLLVFHLCVRVLPACTYVYHVCAWCLHKPEEVIRPSGTGVRLCELHVGAENGTRAALLSHLFGAGYAGVSLNGPSRLEALVCL